MNCANTLLARSNFSSLVIPGFVTSLPHSSSFIFSPLSPSLLYEYMRPARGRGATHQLPGQPAPIDDGSFGEYTILLYTVLYGLFYASFYFLSCRENARERDGRRELRRKSVRKKERKCVCWRERGASCDVRDHIFLTGVRNLREGEEIPRRKENGNVLIFTVLPIDRSMGI